MPFAGCENGCTTGSFGTIDIPVMLSTVCGPVRPGPDMIRRFERPTPGHGVFPTSGMLYRLPRLEVNFPEKT